MKQRRKGGCTGSFLRKGECFFFLHGQMQASPYFFLEPYIPGWTRKFTWSGEHCKNYCFINDRGQKDLKLPNPTSLLKVGATRAGGSSQVLSISEDGDPSTSLSNLSQCSTPVQYESYLMIKWNFLYLTLGPLPPVILLGTIEKSLALSSLSVSPSSI